MGCAPQKKTPSLTYAHSPVGELKVSVLETYLPPDANIAKPFIKFRVTNQAVTQKVAPADSENQVLQNHTFFINSFYQAHGRAVEAAAFDGGDLRAYGAADINPVIMNPGEAQEFRVILAS